jgi:DNA-binding CsgD family transcriptional regulator/alkylhydroperoxidase/carboxymuconolactone decarboxylase family protein YurZ
VAGARTTLREVDGLLRRRPHLGVLGQQADQLRAQVDTIRADALGASSSLTAAMLRLLPLLTTHLTFREIGERLHLSPHTVKTQAVSIYSKLVVARAVRRSTTPSSSVCSRHSWTAAVPVFVLSGRGDAFGVSRDVSWTLGAAVHSPGKAPGSRRAVMNADHKERLRRLALHDDGVIRSMLTIDLGDVEGSGLDLKSSALVRLGALVASDAPRICYQREVEWALAAGATADEVVGTLMAVAPITGVARVLAAAPDLALALGYDLYAAFEALNEDLG